MEQTDPQRFELDRDDPALATQAALEALDAGELVIVPTETVYGLAAREDRPGALRALEAVKRDRTQPFSLAVESGRRLDERLVPWSGPARRIAERWWPGPVTQVLTTRDGRGTLGVRVPGHPWTRELIAACPAALLLPSANLPGETAPLSVAEIDPSLLPSVAVLVDGGRAALGESSTVVRPGLAGLRVLREGVVSRADLALHGLGQVLVVCSGNTCRSPMAATLLAEAFRLRAQEDPGFLAPEVRSAGVWAGRGAGASSGALAAMEHAGLDLTQHSSRSLTPELMAASDVVLCMTQSHVAAVREMLPDPGPTVELFAAQGQDISDPFGGSGSVYAACAEELERHAGSQAQRLCPTD